MATRRRGALVERSFAHILDRRGMRGAWLRGRENLHKRYLIHVAGFNLGVLMRSGDAEGGRICADFRSSNRGRAGLRPDRRHRDGELAAIVIVAANPTWN